MEKNTKHLKDYGFCKQDASLNKVTDLDNGQEITKMDLDWNGGGIVKYEPEANPEKWFGDIQKDVEHRKNNVDHPDYYTWLKDLAGVEVIDIARWLDFDLGNAIKYILRCGRKTDDRTTDLKKAIWYLKDELEMIKKEEA